MSYRKVLHSKCRIQANATQSIGSNGTATPIILAQFGTVLETNPDYIPTASGIVVVKRGVYEAQAHINFPGAAGSYRHFGIYQFSSTVGQSQVDANVIQQPPITGGNWFCHLVHDCRIATPGNLISVGVAHDVGSSQTMNSGSTWLKVRRIGDIE